MDKPKFVKVDGITVVMAVPGGLLFRSHLHFTSGCAIHTRMVSCSVVEAAEFIAALE